MKVNRKELDHLAATPRRIFNPKPCAKLDRSGKLSLGWYLPVNLSGTEPIIGAGRQQNLLFPIDHDRPGGNPSSCGPLPAGTDPHRWGVDDPIHLPFLRPLLL